MVSQDRAAAVSAKFAFFIHKTVSAHTKSRR
jgi:hypothetical protein